MTSQAKVITTAVASVIMLGRRLSSVQWVSLLILTAGMVVMQLKDGPEVEAGGGKGAQGAAHVAPRNTIRGALAMLVATALSAYAGVFLEKLFKTIHLTLWLQSVQLSLFALPIAGGCVLAYDSDSVLQGQLLRGLNGWAWFAILLNAVGGIAVSMALKYADNILKTFAVGGSIVLNTVVSATLFGVRTTPPAPARVGALWGHVVRTAVSVLRAAVLRLRGAPPKRLRAAVSRSQVTLHAHAVLGVFLVVASTVLFTRSSAGAKHEGYAAVAAAAPQVSLPKPPRCIGARFRPLLPDPPPPSPRHAPHPPPPAAARLQDEELPMMPHAGGADGSDPEEHPPAHEPAARPTAERVPAQRVSSSLCPSYFSSAAKWRHSPRNASLLREAGGPGCETAELTGADGKAGDRGDLKCGRADGRDTAGGLASSALRAVSEALGQFVGGAGDAGGRPCSTPRRWFSERARESASLSRQSSQLSSSERVTPRSAPCPADRGPSASLSASCSPVSALAPLSAGQLAGRAGSLG